MFLAQTVVYCVPVNEVGQFCAPGVNEVGQFCAPGGVHFQQHELQMLPVPAHEVQMTHAHVVPGTPRVHSQQHELQIAQVEQELQMTQVVTQVANLSVFSSGMKSGAEAGQAILKLLQEKPDTEGATSEEGSFDFSTPEPSPRQWQSSSLPDTPLQRSPASCESMASTTHSIMAHMTNPYAPSPMAGCYAVMFFPPVAAQPMAPDLYSSGFHNSSSNNDLYSSGFGEPEGSGWCVPEADLPQESPETWPEAAALVPGQVLNISDLWEVGNGRKLGEDEQLSLQEGELLRTPPSPAPGSAATRLVPEGSTTLVIRNIPARYHQDMLLEEFSPDGSFDFFFVPYNFKDSRTMGIAFINFRTHESALHFQKMWHRQYLQDHGRTKHLDVAAATTQGLRANLTQFNSKSIARFQKAGMLPVFLDESANRLDPIQQLRRYGIAVNGFARA